MRYEHVIWDWNGTLLNDVWLSVEVINEVLQKYALNPISKDDYMRLFDFPVYDFYRELGFDFEKSPFEVVGAEFIDIYNARRHECALHDGARDFLQSAENAGLRQSILSAYEKGALDSIILQHNIGGYFTEVSGLSDIFAASKERLGILHMERLGVDPSRAVMVGDTTHDLHVAQAMGVDCVLKAQGHHAMEKLSGRGARVVETFCELFALIA